MWSFLTLQFAQWTPQLIHIIFQGASFRDFQTGNSIEGPNLGNDRESESNDISFSFAFQPSMMNAIDEWNVMRILEYGTHIIGGQLLHFSSFCMDFTGWFQFSEQSTSYRNVVAATCFSHCHKPHEKDLHLALSSLKF